MTRKAPAHIRPWAPAWQVLAFLGTLLVVGALGWALLIGAGWLVWTYALAAGSIIGALAVVTFCVYLAVKGNVRARVLAAAVFGALVVVVGWAVYR